MAAVLQIGTQAEYDGTSAYDLYDNSANHFYLKSDGRGKEKPSKVGGVVMTFSLIISGTTVALIKAQEKLLIKHLVDAMRYIGDEAYDEPVFIFDGANNETVRKAVILEANLLPVPMGETDVSLGFLRGFYVLGIRRGAWESASVTTINAETFDGADHTELITSELNGDMNNRIKQLAISATATNTEVDPLVDFFMGMRRKGENMSDFDPIIEIEHASWLLSTDDDTVVDDAASNCYPSGSSADNCILCDFGNTAGNAKRAKVSILDAIQGHTNLITNGDAETGDMTGWTEEDAGMAADAAHENSGTYGFYSNTTEGNTTWYTQKINVSVGDAHKVSFYTKVDGITSPDYVLAYVSARYLDSGDSPLEIIGYKELSSTHSYTKTTVIGVAPASTATLEITMIAVVSDDPGSSPAIQFAVDDIEVRNTIQDSWNGQYTLLMRSKLSEAGTVNAYINYGYTSSDALKRIAMPQKITHTDWKLTPMGTVTIPPQRVSQNQDNVWIIGNLGFELWMERLSGVPSIYVDCLILVPAKHRLSITGCSVARSSNYSNDAKQSDLIIDITETDKPVITSESSDFIGVDKSVRAFFGEHYSAPYQEDFMFIIFGQTETVHNIGDDFVVSMETAPRYQFRNWS